MKILSIETSCDETGLALLECSGGPKKPKFKILKEVLSSQIKIHAPYGGVVPGLAKREHIKNLPLLLKKVLDSRFQIPDSIDTIAVTMGPGLEPALWTGIEFAKDLSKRWKKPLIGVNHMEGHLYSVLLDSKLQIPDSAKLFPAIALIVSGGHTILLRMDDILSWKKLGETRDDAVGEAFDKAARLLNLPYPGGPQISRIAAEGDPGAVEFPRPMLHSKDYDFSFSGLKTAVLYYLRDLSVIPAKAGIQKFTPGSRLVGRDDKDGPEMTDKMKADVAASFETAAVEVLVKKTFRAVEQYGGKSVWLSGGVAANRLLRAELKMAGRKLGVPLVVADKKHNTDNGAMIGAAAYMGTFRKKRYPLVAKGDLAI